MRRGNRIALSLGRQRLQPISGSGASVVARPHIGTDPAGPLVARRLLSRPTTIRVGAQVPGLTQRLTRALVLLRRAWPGAFDDVRSFTEIVVPLDEPGTVSYSISARPGYSFINVWGKTYLQLVDDLLHETAHHKLHALEELVRFGSLRVLLSNLRSGRPDRCGRIPGSSRLFSDRHLSCHVGFRGAESPRIRQVVPAGR